MGVAKSKGAGPGAGPPPPPPAAREAADAGPEGLGGRRANRVMVTRDGRHLSFAEAGDPAGFPVLCFFGVGSSRYLVLLFDDAARRLGLRVIACDRPGFGRSSPAAGGGFAAFARDVEALCATLRLRRVALWGHSVGCAYAAACALHEPLRRRRLAARLALVSPWVPLDSPGVPLHFRAARFFPHSLAALAAPGAVDEQRRRLRRGGGAADEALSAPAAALAALGLAGAARGELHLCGAPAEDDEDEADAAVSREELSARELRALEDMPLARRARRGARLTLVAPRTLILPPSRAGAPGERHRGAAPGPPRVPRRVRAVLRRLRLRLRGRPVAGAAVPRVGGQPRGGRERAVAPRRAPARPRRRGRRRARRGAGRDAQRHGLREPAAVAPGDRPRRRRGGLTCPVAVGRCVMMCPAPSPSAVDQGGGADRRW